MDLFTHIAKRYFKTGTHVASGFLVLLAVVLVSRNALSGMAADLACGDTITEGSEQCDDGNLVNGDGCSSECTLEICGNGFTDFKEQCDDGNSKDGDGCNRYCQIEFCGDRKVQEVRGEECDDGNGVSGDGCTSLCKIEVAPKPAAPEEEKKKEEETPQQEIALEQQAEEALTFLESPEGETVTQYLTTDETGALQDILEKIQDGAVLSEEEKVISRSLIEKLEQAREEERIRYTDLLKEFIATPISSGVVEEKNLQKENLVDAAVPVVINELTRAVEVIRRGELKSQVNTDLLRLQQQQLDITSELPKNFNLFLDGGSRPIEVFATIKALKETTERYATKDMNVSRNILRTEAQKLLANLPQLKEQYGLDDKQAKELLDQLVNLVSSAKSTPRSIVASVNRFLGFMQKENVFTQADISLYDKRLHAAANVQRIAEELGQSSQIAGTDGARKYVEKLAANVPEDVRNIFEKGTLEEQRGVLLDLLNKDERSASLRELLAAKGSTEFGDRLEALKEDISHSGELRDTPSPCDDSMSESLTCVREYLLDLQNAVRNKSFFTKIIGYIQDLLGIGT